MLCCTPQLIHPHVSMQQQQLASIDSSALQLTATVRQLSTTNSTAVASSSNGWVLYNGSTQPPQSHAWQALHMAGTEQQKSSTPARL
mmetsp:Transcript_35896/g.90645  ORF Transcript_35896/g.90645 Transcript_35896/m.90645 type:complete len:87 (+) Transcript_35896:47-307(+)